MRRLFINVCIILTAVILSSCNFNHNNPGISEPTIYKTAGPWVFIGGSITNGAGSSAQSKCYVNLVADTRPFVNLGIGGENSYDDALRFYSALEYNPSVIFIDAGVNDKLDLPMNYISSQVITASMTNMANAAKDAGALPIIIDFADKETLKIMIADPDWVCEAMNLHSTVAARTGSVYLNVAIWTAAWCRMYGYTTDDKLNELFLPDGIHPNDFGHYLNATFIKYVFGF